MPTALYEIVHSWIQPYNQAFILTKSSFPHLYHVERSSQISVISNQPLTVVKIHGLSLDDITGELGIAVQS